MLINIHFVFNFMKRVYERYPETEVATSNYRRPEIDTKTLPVNSGTYKEVSI